MSTPARLLVLALAVAFVVVASILVLEALRSEGEPGPTTRPSAAASGEASPSPTAAGSQDVAGAFAEIEEQVRALRGLPAPEIGPAEIIDRAALATELEELLAAEWTDEELADANLTLRAMGLLTPDQDLRELSQALLADQVIGFYDPLEERMVVVSDEGLSVLARITYAHEYTHALQDAAFRSFDEREALTDDDAILARQALEEGDASVVMIRWALGHLAPEELQEVAAVPQPDTSGVPGWMLRQLQFPYLAGATFVAGLLGSGDWAAVNDAYTRAPVSTEQVIHPEKYLAGEEPVGVEPVPLAAELGAGWDEIAPTTIGEAMIDIWLVELGAAQADGTPAAAGWGGDRLTVARGPDGSWAMAWRIAWDSASEADEFAAVHAGVAPGSGVGATLLRPSATETLVLHASSAGVLADLEASLAD
jgi:hypothetical protein